MKNLFTIALMVIALAFSSEAMAQKFSGLDKSPADIASYPTDYKVSEKLVRVTYSRPQLKGRSISELAPAGKVWRTGANEAPEIIFYKDTFIHSLIPFFSELNDSEKEVIKNYLSES